MRLPVLLMALAILLTGTTPGFAEIEAIKGKRYTLTKKHGPWMIMVAVFSEPPPELKGDGIGPEQAAEELVYELRTKGIPAYVYERDQRVESIQTMNRRQEKEERFYKLRSEICVLAGNYNNIQDEDSLGKRTLTWIKKYKPECLEKGGIYKPTPGQPGPLSGAFMSVNPMLDPGEVKRRQRDPDIIRYNAHIEYSLLDNPGKYSVTVVSFHGNSVTQVGATDASEAKLGDCGLDVAADQAWQVMRALRERGIEAWVFHDRHKSIVTVGSFNSKTDPGVLSTIKKFGAKQKTDPQTGQTSIMCEPLVLPNRNGQWMCMFDPQPKLIEVPYKN